ncbi:hypothetical protein I4U23_003461 [Adineta vaga]|nr:hypothetical protein I4U23_003461 [Adineta vaga]
MNGQVDIDDTDQKDAQQSNIQGIFSGIQRLNNFITWTFERPFTIINTAVENVQSIITGNAANCALCMCVTISVTLSVTSVAVGIGVGVGVGCSS